MWLGEERKCSATVVGLDLLGFSMVRWCSLNRSFKRRLVAPVGDKKSKPKLLIRYLIVNGKLAFGVG